MANTSKKNSLNKNFPQKQDIINTLKERHTEEIYEKLKNAKVAVFGLGGLGSNISESLVRSGIGELLLVDFDKVDLSNLNRQNYSINNIGLYKTDALKKQLMQINPYTKISIKTIKVTEENVVSLLKGFDVICEAFDDPKSKALLVNACLSNFPNVKIVSGSGMAGLASSNIIKTQKKMNNLYICGDMENGIEKCGTLFSSRVLICAGHQANMIVRLLIGITEP